MKITENEKENIFGILEGGKKALQVYFDMLDKQAEIKEPELNKGKIYKAIFSTLESIGIPLDTELQRQFRGKFELPKDIYNGE